MEEDFIGNLEGRTFVEEEEEEDEVADAMEVEGCEDSDGTILFESVFAFSCGDGRSESLAVWSF